MKKWYFTGALLAGWLGQAGIASAQSSHIPTPYGATRMAEPLPCGPTPPGPELVPGPIDPAATPPVPPQGTEYPADHTSAFQCEENPSDDHWYIHAGAEGLLRQKLGGGLVASSDPVAQKNGFESGTGVVPVQNLDGINQDWNVGPKLTVGYLWQNPVRSKFLVSYIPLNHTSNYTQAPGQLDLPFFNAPVGFEGDNGMWLHADTVTSTFQSSMTNVELNYRYTDAAITDAELIFGLRWLSLYESLAIYTGDDDLTFHDKNNNPDPTRQATYQSQTHNNIIGPQVGFEWGHSATEYFTIGITGKAAGGINFVEEHNTLIRGDGLQGFDYKRNITNFAGIYEAGAFVDFNILERVRLRVGYNAMFLVNVAPAAEQLDFNLANPSGRNEVHSTIFYHGPMAELQILF